MSARINRALLGTAAALALALPGLAQAQTSASLYTYAARYDAAGRTVGTIAPDPDGSGSIHFAATRTTYDDAGRVTRVEKLELSGWQDQSILPQNWTGITYFAKVETSYDALDRKTLETSSGWNGSAWVANAATQYSYDGFGRLDCTAVRMNPAIYTSLPSSACTLGTAGTAGNDRITRNSYDAAGQLLKVQQAYGITTANGFPRTLQEDYTTNTYTVNGKLDTMTDANGNKATMAYDAYDRQIAWIFPSKTTAGSSAACTIGTVSEGLENGVYVTGPSTSRTAGDDCEKYAYDRNGVRKKLIKRDGHIIGYNYDALGQMTLKDIDLGGSSTATDVYYDYDLRGLQLSARFASASGAGITNTFDGFGRQLTTSSDMSGTARTLTYEWDADSNRTKIIYPSGSYFTYDHDGLDRLTAIKESGSTTLVARSYNTLGQRATEARGPVTTSYTYDPLARLTSLSDATPDTNSAVATTYSYGPAGQILSKARSNDAYAFGSYVNVNRPYTTNGLNQYATAGTATFTYDDNGNLTSDGTTTYVYDVENRLVSTSSGANTNVQEYDPLGRLWRNVTNGTNALVMEYDGDHIISTTLNSTPVVYVNGEGQDDPLIWIGTTTRFAMQADHQGSITSLVNMATGATYAINTYDEYGIPGAGNTGRLQYTGQLYIANLGMYYYKARFYSPTLGRFMQTDPIGYKDQNNLYAYVGNDPIDRTDWNGMCGRADCEGGHGAYGDMGEAHDATYDAVGMTFVKTMVAQNMRIVDAIKKDPKAVAQVREAWRESMPYNDTAHKREVAFFMKYDGKDFAIGNLVWGQWGVARIGEASLDAARKALPGANVLFHTHPFHVGEHISFLEVIASQRLDGGDMDYAKPRNLSMVVLTWGQRTPLAWDSNDRFYKGPVPR